MFNKNKVYIQLQYYAQGASFVKMEYSMKSLFEENEII